MANEFMPAEPVLPLAHADKRLHLRQHPLRKVCIRTGGVERLQQDRFAEDFLFLCCRSWTSREDNVQYIVNLSGSNGFGVILTKGKVNTLFF